MSPQVFVRETTETRKSSSPVALTVVLTDENDNAPVIEGGVNDVTLPAGSSRRKIATLLATDIDSTSSKGGLKYSLVHVSNNGMRKFTVNARTGAVEVVAAVTAGERFSLTVGATDSGGKSTRTILEVRVSAGPNLRGPIFEQVRNSSNSVLFS
jgi:protocadherin-15